MRHIHVTLLATGLVFTPVVPAAGMQHAGHGAMNMSGMHKAMSWTDAPLLKVRVSGESREQTVAAAVPQNIAASNIDAWSNDLKDEKAHRQLPLEMAGAKLDRPASGGFHWLAAREEQAGKVLVASTVYPFGERGAKDPTAMFMQQKHELEIIPQPFPREHSRYRADESWKFLVRFNGEPLPSQKIMLQTQNGTNTELLSDVQGIVTVRLPDDFKVEEAKEEGGHSHRMPGSDFVLATGHIEGSKTYFTAFNSSYGKNAFDQRSLAMGLGFTLLGMIGAVPLLRQRKTERNNMEAGNA